LFLAKSRHFSIKNSGFLTPSLIHSFTSSPRIRSLSTVHRSPQTKTPPEGSVFIWSDFRTLNYEL